MNRPDIEGAMECPACGNITLKVEECTKGTEMEEYACGCGYFECRGASSIDSAMGSLVRATAWVHENLDDIDKWGKVELAKLAFISGEMSLLQQQLDELTNGNKGDFQNAINK